MSRPEPKDVRIPLLYDMYLQQSLEWPSYACAWGDKDPNSENGSQTLYMSRSTTAEQLDSSLPGQWKGRPNAIEVYHVDSDSARLYCSKKFIHPGEVNRIRVCHQHGDIIATHSDCPEVFVWNSNTQPNRQLRVDAECSVPDIILKGHTKNAPYALDFNSQEPLIISGGSDNNIHLWSLEDEVHIVKDGERTLRTLPSRQHFRGHSASVEDCAFHPLSPFIFVSVGDDCAMRLWDSRDGTDPVASAKNLHAKDINSVSWNKQNEMLLLSGGSDHLVKISDIRYIRNQTKKSPALQTFSCLEGSVTTVQWSPHSSSYFATASEDGMMLIFNRDRKPLSDDQPGLPEEIFFRHIGHGKSPVVDFDWNSRDPWTIATVSDDADTYGGGTLQVWRLSELLTGNDDQLQQDIAKSLELMDKSSRSSQ